MQWEGDGREDEAENGRNWLFDKRIDDLRTRVRERERGRARSESADIETAGERDACIQRHTHRERESERIIIRFSRGSADARLTPFIRTM